MANFPLTDTLNCEIAVLNAVSEELVRRSLKIDARDTKVIDIE